MNFLRVSPLLAKSSRPDVVQRKLEDMADGSDREQDRLGEKWLTNWEDQCVEQWETETNMDDKLQTETETSSQKLWQSFQNSASNISFLYKGEKYVESCDM